MEFDQHSLVSRSSSCSIFNVSPKTSTDIKLKLEYFHFHSFRLPPPPISFISFGESLPMGSNKEPWKTQIKNSHLSLSDMYVSWTKHCWWTLDFFAIHLFPFKFKRIGNATRLYAFQFQHFSFRKTFKYLAWKVHGMLYLVILSPLNKDK